MNSHLLGLCSVAKNSGGGRQLCPCQCHPDLSWIRFGNGIISVGDVDCLFVVERHGKFLYMEWKRENEITTQGQEILLKALSEVDKFTVLVVIHDGGIPFQYVEVCSSHIGRLKDTNKPDFQKRIDSWYKMANA